MSSFGTTRTTSQGKVKYLMLFLHYSTGGFLFINLPHTEGGLSNWLDVRRLMHAMRVCDGMQAEHHARRVSS